MRILFLFVSLPNLAEDGVFVDLIKEFQKQGHSVKVATPWGKGTVEGLNKEAGIDVLRFKTDQLTQNSSNIQKGIAYLKYVNQSLKSIKKVFDGEQFDLIIAHSLPPELALVVRKLKKYYSCQFYLILCEYIWQDAEALGMIKKNGIISKYYQRLEKLLIQQADFIGCPSQGNIDFFLGYYPWAKHKNISILHHCSYAPVVEKDTEIRKRLELNNKFLVIYGGNASIAQKLENVIHLAENCQEYEDIIFIIVGRGPEMDKMKTEAANRKISNIRFLAFMPKTEYLQLLANCDVGLISLNESLAIPNIPSKTLSYWALSIPIVASIDKNTDYGEYLDFAGGGLWSIAGDMDHFKSNLLTFYNNPELRKEMGLKGNTFFTEQMVPGVGYKTIMDQIHSDKK